LCASATIRRRVWRAGFGARGLHEVARWLVGYIANEDWRWRRRHNYYLNCLRDADRPHRFAAGRARRAPGWQGKENDRRASPRITATSTRAHRLHGKGATAYREQNNVPLIVAQPGSRGGQALPGGPLRTSTSRRRCGAERRECRSKGCAHQRPSGKDFSSLLAAPDKAATRRCETGPCTATTCLRTSTATS
jgi:arylsulfatase